MIICASSTEQGSLVRPLIRTALSAIKENVVAILLLFTAQLAPAAAQQIVWSDFQSTIAAPDLIGKSADHAFDTLLAVGHKCGAWLPDQDPKGLNSMPHIFCIITRSDPDPDKCQAMGIDLYTSPREYASHASYLESLARRRVTSVFTYCMAQAFGPDLRDRQRSGNDALREQISSLNLVGMSQSEALLVLRGEGYLCGSNTDQSIECVRPFTRSKTCAAPDVRFKLDSPARTATKSTGSGSSIPHVEEPLVINVFAECSVPWWLQDSKQSPK